MKVTTYRINLFFLILMMTVPQVKGQSFEWGSSLPETEGFSSEKLYAMRDTLAKYDTSTLLVIRNDKIVLEWYAEGWHPKRPHGTASVAKALVGGMSLLLAEHDGRLEVNEPASKYIPEWRKDPMKSKITLLHLATHSSGIEDSEITEEELAEAKGMEINHMHMDLPGWKGDFWRQEPDPFSVSRDEAPVLFTPGTAFQYSNPGMAMLAYAVTASYQGTDWPDLRTLLWERLYKPIGIKKDEWFIGYRKTFQTGGLDLVANWGGAGFTPRAAARIGRLMLRKGNWEGEQLIDSFLVKRAVDYSGMALSGDSPPSYLPSGLAWFCNYNGTFPRLPCDAFLAYGAGNRVVIVIPSKNMIVVRNGGNMFDSEKGEAKYHGVENYLVNMLMDAMIEPPYPMSNVIRDVEFAPENSIIRKACGSDTWPVTWADDDNLYTAYGDGWGFEPEVKEKLSLGLARISGGPEDFRGTNIRSETGEHYGSGRNGKKASGMLMVDGVLYMWLRNANEAGEHSQLAWSENYGKTWAFSNWKLTESFGYPTFLNFGKNYQGARDEYVYVYSHDNKDAYKPADHMVLARVPKGKIKQRNEYEFFKSLDENGQPRWTKNIAERGPVFTNPNGCFRSGITYNAGLKRYLWSQILPVSQDAQFQSNQDDMRFHGGFGIYEAPEPWGPWRTVYYTKDWDVGPGETSSIPSKWMSSDGKTCHLLFSGEDCFSVRKVIFETDSE